MKIKSLLIGASVLGFAAAAQAQTVINITGATAFRSAAHSAILTAFNSSGALGTTYNIATTGTNAANAGQVIYKGTFPGITGTTTIRTSWTGSVEGLRALTKPTDSAVTSGTKYIIDNTTTWSGLSSGIALSVNGTNTAALNGTTAKHDFAFSDCVQKSAPTAYQTPTLNGGAVGVIAFAPVVNKDSDAGITNITSQLLRRLHSAGTIRLSMLTGNTSQNGTSVYNVQRYDGSGTRVITLSEIGYGAAIKSTGYVFANFTLSSTPEVCPASTNSTTYSVYGTDSGSNRVANSTDYNITQLGNGGYVSGSSIAKLMFQSGSNTIVSVLGTGDCKTAYNSGAGGRILSYNGVRLDGLAATGLLNTADKDKVRSGAYSLWSTENLYYVGTLSAAKLAVYNKLKADQMTDTVLGTGGIALSGLQVQRNGATTTSSSDGGVIAPK